MKTNDISEKENIDLIASIQKTLVAIPLEELGISAGSTSRERVPVLFLIEERPCGLCFILTKRSRFVPQPGDISCPGGAVEPAIDVPVAEAIRQGAFSVCSDEFPAEIWQSGKAFVLIAAALREAREEIGLESTNVSIRGLLPPYDLRLFAKSIVPIVGQIKSPWLACIGDEVERLISIPLLTFFDEANYVCLEIAKDETASVFPAVAIPNDEGGEDILWGATFFIVERFLHRCFDFHLPDYLNKRRITRRLDERYLYGEDADGNIVKR